jgi:hypothetical protein
MGNGASDGSSTEVKSRAHMIKNIQRHDVCSEIIPPNAKPSITMTVLSEELAAAYALLRFGGTRSGMVTKLKE